MGKHFTLYSNSIFVNIKIMCNFQSLDDDEDQGVRAVKVVAGPEPSRACDEFVRQ